MRDNFFIGIDFNVFVSVVMLVAKIRKFEIVQIELIKFKSTFFACAVALFAHSPYFCPPKWIRKIGHIGN